MHSKVIVHVYRYIDYKFELMKQLKFYFQVVLILDEDQHDFPNFESNSLEK